MNVPAMLAGYNPDWTPRDPVVFPPKKLPRDRYREPRRKVIVAGKSYKRYRPIRYIAHKGSWLCADLKDGVQVYRRAMDILDNEA